MLLYWFFLLTMFSWTLLTKANHYLAISNIQFVVLYVESTEGKFLSLFFFLWFLFFYFWRGDVWLFFLFFKWLALSERDTISCCHWLWGPGKYHRVTRIYKGFPRLLEVPRTSLLTWQKFLSFLRFLKDTCHPPFLCI